MKSCGAVRFLDKITHLTLYICYRDATITLDPAIENQTLEVFIGSHVSGSPIASIDVTIEKKKIKGFDIKTQVLAVSNSDILIGSLHFAKGMSWIDKDYADKLITQQRALAVVGVARDVRKAPVAAAKAVKRGVVAVAKAIGGLADLIKRLGASITGPIGEMAKSIGTFAKLVVTGGDANIVHAFKEQNLQLVQENLNKLSDMLQNDKVLLAMSKALENPQAEEVEPELQGQVGWQAVDTLFSAIRPLLDTIKTGLEELVIIRRLSRQLL